MTANGVQIYTAHSPKQQFVAKNSDLIPTPSTNAAVGRGSTQLGQLATAGRRWRFLSNVVTASFNS